MKQYEIKIPTKFVDRMSDYETIKMMCFDDTERTFRFENGSISFSEKGNTYVELGDFDYKRAPRSWLEEIKEEIDWVKVKSNALVESFFEIGIPHSKQSYINIHYLDEVLNKECTVEGHLIQVSELRPASQIPLATWKELFYEGE